MKLTYYVFENLGDGKFKGYEDGDRLELAATGEITEPPSDALLEELFNLYNRDDRPNGKIAPSMSVGDVITLVSSDPQIIEAYAVEGLGFRKLDTKPVPTPEQLADYRERLRLAKETGSVVRSEAQQEWLDGGGPGETRMAFP